MGHWRSHKQKGAGFIVRALEIVQQIMSVMWMIARPTRAMRQFVFEDHFRCHDRNWRKWEANVDNRTFRNENVTVLWPSPCAAVH